ncbi:hypothetical protein FB451DRAFT_1493277 [Mycena latifolia]|nr:hypothetical protein FB451DRAFT_1493277 [Mycena latifolia]
MFSEGLFDIKWIVRICLLPVFHQVACGPFPLPSPIQQIMIVFRESGAETTHLTQSIFLQSAPRSSRSPCPHRPIWKNSSASTAVACASRIDKKTMPRPRRIAPAIHESGIHELPLNLVTRYEAEMAERDDSSPSGWLNGWMRQSQDPMAGNQRDTQALCWAYASLPQNMIGALRRVLDPQLGEQFATDELNWLVESITHIDACAAIQHLYSVLKQRHLGLMSEGVRVAA